MAEKANDEVKNIPSEPIAKLPTLPESLTEKKNRKEDLDNATLSELSEAIVLSIPDLELPMREEYKPSEIVKTISSRESESSESEVECSDFEVECSDFGLKYLEDDQSVPKIKELEKRERVLDKRQDVLNNRERVLNNRERVLDKRQNVLDKRQDVLDERQNVLDERQDVLNNRERVLNNRERVLNNRERVLNNRERELEKRERVLDKRQNVLNNRERELEKRERVLDKRQDELEKRERVLDKRQDVLEKLEGELENRKIVLEKREGDLEGDMNEKAHKGMAEAFELSEADSGSLGSRRTAGDATEINESRDDDVVLDPFLCSGSLTDIRELIESGKLPSQKILDEMCKVYERKSQEIAITCKAIVEHIKSKHAGIVHVWAAYTIQNPHKIIFVVIVKDKSENDDRTEPLSLDKLITYSFVNQYVGEFSSEGSEVIKKHTSASGGFDEESYQKLQSCISKHSEDLMKKHKYLSIISACSNRSKGFGESWELVPEKCIVLYVHKKNYIPIDEEPFKTNYDDIPVDVREGAFIPYGHTAGEKLDPVRMGCQIGGDSFSGTLGCFIDHPQYGVCGLTCAHVLLHSLKLKRLKSLGMVKWPLHGMSTNVYQPADNQSVLGNVVQLICKKGTGNTCGMDVALFRITDRQPKTANFPDATAISGSSFQTINYDSWRMCDTGMLNLTQDRVVKFGSTTELRDGKIIFDAMGVKELESCPLFSGCATITLFNQIEVKDHTQGFCFADRGDSGALVFVVDDNNSQHTCIGIVEGGTTYGTVVVTPIVPILEELNVPGLKSFETETTLSHIHDNINNIHGDIQGLHGDIHGLQADMQNVSHKIQNIDSNMQAVGNAVQGVQTLNNDMQIIKQLLSNLRP